MIKHIISFTLCFCCCLVSVAQNFSALNDDFITHYNAGRYHEALPIGLKLVKLAATEFGLNDINYAITNENVGNTYAKLEAWEESLPYLHEARRAYTGAAGTHEVVEVGLCYNGIANSHLSMGTYDSARNYFVAAYNYFINYPVDQYDNFIVVAGNLISVSFMLDQTGDVAVIAENLLPVIEKQESAESETYLEFLGHAGSGLRGSQKFREALVYYSKALPLAQKLFGNTHNNYAGILEQAGECYRNLGHFDSCRSMLQNAGSIYRGNTSTDAYTLANFQHNIANLNGDLAIFDKAILHYDSAISYMKIGGYEKDVLYATILKSKAYTYMDANKNMEASELLKKVAAYYEEQFGSGLLSNAEIFISLANNEYFLNQLAAAENHLLAARSILEKNEAQDTYLYARIFELEGLIEHGKGNSTKAIELCKKAELLNSKIFGEGSQYTASCLSNQGIIYQETGDYVKAEEVLRKSFMVRNKLLGTEHPQTALSMANLAMVLVMQARYDDADKLLAASLEIMMKNGMLATSNTQTILNNIALLAQRQGDYENAENCT
jgi:Flp pilus assembly protein TadD